MEALETFERIASQRKTVKMMTDAEVGGSRSGIPLDRLLSCAGWAPFHRMCSPDHRSERDQPAGIEPWRFHLLEASDCRVLREFVLPMPASGKIPAMLACCDALVLATWLPNPRQDASNHADPEAFEPTVENVEHIAAASSAVQTLLLAATAAGIDNYWSSGGVLRSAPVFELLGIPKLQRLLGAIFLFPNPDTLEVPPQRVSSKLRESRGDQSAWSRRVRLGNQAIGLKVD